MIHDLCILPGLVAPVRKALASALILPGLSDVGYPGGSSTVRTGTSLVQVSQGFSLWPEKKDGDQTSQDGDP